MNKLGFGYMRLPMLENGEIDLEHCTKMVDAFMEAGFNYFDTARAYTDSEEKIGLALSDVRKNIITSSIIIEKPIVSKTKC